MDILNGRNPFKNCIKIVVPKGTENVNRLSIFNGLKSIIQADTQYISGISPFNTGNNWIVYFKDVYDCQFLANQTITIGQQSFSIISAQNELDPYIYQTYRLHWLFELNIAELDNIKKYFQSLNKSLQVMDIKPEYPLEEDIKHIANGNYRVKIRFLAKDKNQINIRTGKHRLGPKIFTLITRLGEKPRCLLCQSEEHLRKNCPNRILRCTRCNKTGHLVEQCNLAKQLDNSHEIDEEVDLNKDDLNGQIENEVNIVSNSIKSSQAHKQNSAPNGEPSEIFQQTPTTYPTKPTFNAPKTTNENGTGGRVNNNKVNNALNKVSTPAFQKPIDPKKPPVKPLLSASNDTSTPKRGTKNKLKESPSNNTEEAETKKNKEDKDDENYLEYSDEE